MGSATLPDAKPETMSDNDKITFKSLLKKPLQAFLRKKTKKPTNEIQLPPKTTNQKAPVPNVESLKLTLEKLCLDKNEESDSEDEFKQFTVKVVDEDKTRLDSNCSEDSGFSEKEDQRDLVERFEKLELLKDNKKKKRFQVCMSRGPIRNKEERIAVAAPPYHQIQQVNRQTLTGSQVIITKDTSQPPFYGSRQNYNQDGVLRMALTKVEHNVNNFPANPQEELEYWVTAQEFLKESLKREAQRDDNILSGFKEICPANTVPSFTEFNQSIETTNPIEEFEHADEHLEFNDITIEELQDFTSPIFLTPPRSNENHMSPASFNSPSPSYLHSSTHNVSVASVSSDYLLSPSRSSPNLSKLDDYENYQEIQQFDDIPSCVLESEKKERKKYLSMKNFKQIQSDLQATFVKKSCCQPRKSCKEVFKGFFENLSVDQRSGICLRIAALDLNTANGVLHNIILSLSSVSEREELEYALFGVICEKILAEKPMLYLESFGLNLLKASVLRCPSKPLLTRYIVECVRKALATEQGKAAVDSSPVFNEVDVNGDNLLGAASARGDKAADVLAELVLGAPKLFDVHHANNEGFTPLHIAVRKAGSEEEGGTEGIEGSKGIENSGGLHTVHVLIAHGGADLWRGDMKGGDTALHLAVRSATCSLPLVLSLFRAVDRKEWRRLAHAPNRSSATPLELARQATRSTSRQDYPEEVLAFLKKCR